MKKKRKKKNIKKIKEKLKKKESLKTIGNQKNFKTKEEKIAIEKVKKQATEKREYNIKDYIVYPKHGVGKIVAISKATMGGIEINFYKVFIEKDKLTLSIPINQQSHLRPIASINQINKSISILKSKPKIKRTMWSRRAQEYDQKINYWKNIRISGSCKRLK